MTRLKVTLTKSTINATERQLATVKGLGLRRIGRSRELINTPAVRGMIQSVLHMISVQEVEVAPTPRPKAPKKAAAKEASHG